MLIIGITGSIASGKSYLAASLKQRLTKAYLFDADFEVRKLITFDQAIIARINHNFFPQAAPDAPIQRKKLADMVFKKADKLALLENIIYQPLRQKLALKIKVAFRKRINFLLLDIPLLFENRLDKICHMTILSEAPIKIRRQRFLARSGNQAQLFLLINQRQLAQSKKIKQSDWAIKTSLGKARNHRALMQLVTKLNNFHESQGNCLRHRNYWLKNQ